MFAETDWAVLVPGTITSLTSLAALLIATRNRGDIKIMKPKVHSIDIAVNGQPEGAPPMVERIKGIEVEQSRVADELAVNDHARKEDVDKVATDLEQSHERAEAVTSTEPGEAADAAMRRNK